jgi:hypothetical protein
VILTIPIGVILASAFSAILVYAHELFPGKVGMVSGLFFGFALEWRVLDQQFWAESPTGPALSMFMRSVLLCL